MNHPPRDPSNVMAEVVAAEEAIARGDRDVLANPANMSQAVLLYVGHLFLSGIAPAGPWPPATLVALLKEFRTRILLELPEDLRPGIARRLEKLLARYAEDARLAQEALEQLRTPERRASVPAPPGLAQDAGRAFEGQVVQLAGMFGWLSHHQRPARRQDGSWSSAIQGDAGFPDLVLVRPAQRREGRARVIFAELKSGRGRLSQAQRRWFEALAEVPGLEVYTWRPEQLEEIAGVLA